MVAQSSRLIRDFFSALFLRVTTAMPKQNPRLAAFAPLLGEWITRGTHPQLPGRSLHGSVSFERVEDGAFIRMRSTSAETEIPSGVAIFGTDDAEDNGIMLYFDERGVSR